MAVSIHCRTSKSLLNEHMEFANLLNCVIKDSVTLKNAKLMVKENFKVASKGNEVITQFYTCFLICIKVWKRWCWLIISLVLHTGNARFVHYREGMGCVKLQDQKEKQRSRSFWRKKLGYFRLLNLTEALFVGNTFMKLENEQPSEWRYSSAAWDTCTHNMIFQSWSNPFIRMQWKSSIIK